MGARRFAYNRHRTGATPLFRGISAICGTTSFVTLRRLEIANLPLVVHGIAARAVGVASPRDRGAHHGGSGHQAQHSLKVVYLNRSPWNPRNFDDCRGSQKLTLKRTQKQTRYRTDTLKFGVLPSIGFF